MSTVSAEQMAPKILAIYVRDGTGRPGQILHDLLMQWLNEINPVELTMAFDSRNGWLSQTAIGFELTHAGLATPSHNFSGSLRLSHCQRDSIWLRRYI
jgi:hypothetical protein